MKKIHIYLLSSLILFLLFIMVLSVIAGCGGETSLDNNIFNFIVNNRKEKGFIYYFFKGITYLGSKYIVIILGVIFLILTKINHKGISFSLCLLLVLLLGLAFKELIARERPNEIYWWDNEDNYSFPSGHSIIAGYLYIFIFFIIDDYNMNKKIKLSIKIIMPIIIILVLMSRLILSVHYFTDVIGGVLLGSSIAMLSLALIIFMENHGIFTKPILVSLIEFFKNKDDNNVVKIVPLFLLILITFSSCKGENSKMDVRKTDTIYAMSTQIEVSIFNDDKFDEHFNDIKKIYNRISRLTDNYTSYLDTFNIYNIYDLNELREIPYDDELFYILKQADTMIKKTNGYFNPYIGRLTKYWKNIIEDKDNIVSYDTKIIQEEINIMNNTKLLMDGKTIKLSGDGCIDLGAMAKGYATEKVREYLVKNNIEKYIINAGDSNVLLSKFDEGFNVYFQRQMSNGYYTSLNLNDCSIATSSYKYQHKLYNGNYYHHLISPLDGMPKNYYESVSVITNSSMDADIYSTSLFLMDYDLAYKFVNENNLKALFFKDGEIYKKIGV